MITTILSISGGFFSEVWSEVSNWFVSTGPGPPNIYYTYSASAQSIATFIGFITAGFIFVLSKMDERVTKDETLEEIVAEVKHEHFKTVKRLCWTTGVTIIVSLLIVLLNKHAFPFMTVLEILGMGLSILTIGLAIQFVLVIVDPFNNVKIAGKLLKEDLKQFPPSAGKVNRGVFLESFNDFEKMIRTIGEDIIPDMEKRYGGLSSPSMHDITRALINRNIIDDKTMFRISKLNKLRNLIIHARTEYISKEIYEELEDVTEIIKLIHSKVKT